MKRLIVPLRSVCWSLVAAASTACASPQAAGPRAPTDGDPAVPTTSDGEPVGADRQPPGQKLQQGPSLDSSKGVKPSATPPVERR